MNDLSCYMNYRGSYIVDNPDGTRDVIFGRNDMGYTIRLLNDGAVAVEEYALEKPWQPQDTWNH